MKNTNSAYKSRDLYFSAYLFSKGNKLTAVKLDKSSVFYWFVFPDKEKCEKGEQEFLKNRAIVKAKDYSEAIKYLKRKVSQ